MATLLFGSTALSAAQPPSRLTEAGRLWADLSTSAQTDLGDDRTEKLFESFLAKFPMDPKAPAVRYAQAEREFRLGRYQAAAVAFEKFLQEQPSHPLTRSAAFRLGESYYNLGVFHSAEAAWGRVAKEGGASILTPDAIAWVALLNVRREAWGEADEGMKVLQSRYPHIFDRASSRETAGVVLYHLGEYTDSLRVLEGVSTDAAAYYRGLSAFALKMYEDAANHLKSLPTVGERVYRESAAFLKAEAFFQNRNYTLALEEFRGFLKTFPQSALRPHAALRVAACHLLLREPGDALRAVAELRKLKMPGDVATYGDFIEGAARLALKDYGPASRVLEKVALENRPPSLAAAAWIRKAWAHKQLGEDAPFLQSLKRLEDTQPAAPEVSIAHFLLGARHCERKEWEDAGARFEAAVLRFPYSALSEAELALMSQAYTRAGRLDQLVTAASAALKILSNNYSTASPYWRAQTHFFVGKAYFDLKRFPEAEKHFQRVVSDYTAHPLAPRAQLLLAWCWEEQNRHEKAAQAATVLAQDKKMDKVLAVHAAFLEAVTHFNSKNYDKAIARLAAFLQENPKDPLAPEAYYLIGLSYHQKKVFGSAIESWAKEVDLFPAHPLSKLARLQMGDLYFQAGKYKEAAQSFQAFQSRWPQDPTYGERALWQEIQSLFNGKDDETAIARLRRYATDYPQGPNAEAAAKQLEMVYFRRGEGGDPVKIEEFLRLYPVSPYAPSARFKLGGMAMDQQKWQRAALEFEQFVRDYPKDAQAPDAVFALGQAYEKLDDVPKALEQFKLLMTQYATKPQALDAAFRLGSLHFAKERYQEALDAFQFAAQRRLAPDLKANVTYNMALCYENLGQMESAAKAYGDFARMAKTPEQIREAEMAAALLYKKAEKWAPAQTHLRRLIDRTDTPEEERLQAVNLLAEAQVGAGQMDKAKKSYELLVGLTPADHDLRLAGLAQLAYQYEQEKAFSNAVRIYEKIAVSGGKAEWVQAARARMDALNQQLTPQVP